MKKLALTFSLLCFLFIHLHAQEKSFKVELSYDTVYIGNPIKIQFTIKNFKGDFEAPNLQNFYVVSGPNMNSSFSMVNGETNNEKSYSYLIMPQEVGVYKIPGAQLHTRKESLETPEVSFTVVDNPNDIRQNPEDMHFFPFLDNRVQEDSVEKSAFKNRKLKKT
jgi:hypothetical protein